MIKKHSPWLVLDDANCETTKKIFIKKEWVEHVSTLNFNTTAVYFSRDGKRTKVAKVLNPTKQIFYLLGR